MENIRPKVSVIVAAYESAALLSRCLATLEDQTYRYFETIVVNSSPETRTAEVASGFPHVRFHQHPNRLLPHAARNVGVSMARGGLYAFTDADCKIDPGWLAAFVNAHAQGHPIVCGSIETESSNWISRSIHLLKYAPYLRGRPPGPIGLAATGSLLVSEEAWMKAGPFDGSFFSGDALFSWKATRMGMTPMFEPRAMVVDQDEKLARGFFRSRFQRGSEFGRLRTEFEGWSRASLFARTLLVPVALLASLSSICRHCRLAGRSSDFFLTLPFQLLGQAAWCMGEAKGYASLLLRGRKGGL